jgi:L-alanine-DL-glutamate epimerase-like enolase superfamily enzyme
MNTSDRQASTRIARIDIIPLRIKLNKPFVISLGRIDYAENVAVRIETHAGASGFGECSPFRTINGESGETARVVGEYLKASLLDQDPLDIDTCLQRMDAAIYGNSSIKSAFDIALHDLAARSAGLPLFAFLGGRERKALVTDYTVSLGCVADMVADAVDIMHRGFPSIKIKLGGTLDDDLCRIREIRKAVRPGIPLRLDANQGWSLKTAIQLLSQLDGLNIEFCEEPIPRWDFMNLAKVREASAVSIMADESCCDPHDMERLIDLGACDCMNIKLGKSGGLHRAMKMLRLAEQAGLKVQIGGFVESRLGLTASAHLALSSDCVAWCDFDTALMLEDDPVSGGVVYGANGTLELPDGIGLGASIACS